MSDRRPMAGVKGGIMRLLVSSPEDQASVTIRDELIALGGWEPSGVFEGSPALVRGDLTLITIPGVHLHCDHIDDQVEGELGQRPKEVVFLSRHRAASGQRSLTVHPIGNWDRAEHGGRERELVRAAPDLMTSLLRELKRQAVGLPFEVTFEVTHHGPYLETPTLFIEIGSSEASWGDRDAARAIARSLTEVQVMECPRAIGIGGGHYAPRFTEVSLSKRISFGHLLPNHAFDLTDLDDLAAKIDRGMERSGAALAYVHKKSMKRSEATVVTKLISDRGYQVVDSSDLEGLDQP
jgi:D-aminoacyl-tRNA deacylase